MELTEPSFFIHGWNELVYLLSRVFILLTIGYGWYDSRVVDVCKNCHGVLLIPGHLLKIRNRVNGELVVSWSLWSSYY